MFRNKNAKNITNIPDVVFSESMNLLNLKEDQQTMNCYYVKISNEVPKVLNFPLTISRKEKQQDNQRSAKLLSQSTNDDKLPSNKKLSNLVYTHLYNRQTKKNTPVELIISVNGGAKRMEKLSKQNKGFFINGILKIANKTNIWLITGGFSAGVTKLSCQVKKDFEILKMSHRDQIHGDIRLIGIATINKIETKEKVEIENFVDSSLSGENRNRAESLKKYPQHNVTNDTCINENHDTVIFVRVQEDDQYSACIDFRTEFENLALSEDTQVKIVQIVIEGGEDCLKTIHSALSQNIPIVLIRGTKGMCDALCVAMDKCDENLKTEAKKFQSEIEKEFLKRRRNKDGETKQIKIIDEDVTKGIYDKRNLITIFNIEDIETDFSTAILSAIFDKDVDIARDPKSPSSTQVSARLVTRLNLEINFNSYKTARNTLKEIDWSNESLKENIGHYIGTIIDGDQWEFLDLFTDVNLSFDKIMKIFRDLSKDRLSSRNTGRRNTLTGMAVPKLFPYIYGPLEERECSVAKSDHYKDRESMLQYMIKSLDAGHIEMSKIFWREGSSHVSSALVAVAVCHKLHHRALQEGKEKLSKRLHQARLDYLELAGGILTEALKLNPKSTMNLVSRHLDHLKFHNCLEIADHFKIISFMHHEVCQMKLNRVWYNRILQQTSIFRIFVNIFLFPFITSRIMEKSVIHETNRENSFSLNENEVTNLLEKNDIRILNKSREKSYKISDSQLEKKSKCTDINDFFQAPVTKYLLTIMSYVCFLGIFTYMSLVEFKHIKYVRNAGNMATEIFIYVYVISLFMEEIKQFSSHIRTFGFRRSFHEYFDSLWNWLDVFVIIVFLAAVILRFIPQVDFMAPRILMSITLSLFYMRFMQFYLPFKMLGPNVIMIFKMLYDVFFFVVIYALVILAYGTFAQSIHYSNATLNANILKNIFYYPYWQTYGEMQLDVVEGKKDGAAPNASVIVAFAIYMLISNVLLLNLLIAMFGKTFTNIKEQSDQIWSFNRYKFIKEFSNRPIEPPPFNILGLIRVEIIKLCKATKKNKNCHGEESEDMKMRKQKSNERKLTSSHGHDDVDLERFERFCTQIFIRRTNLFYSD